jgi:photosystem II stability/assembly factor-like uncharacterized protein/uncharacterized membrane protein YedE/YeeE
MSGFIAAGLLGFALLGGAAGAAGSGRSVSSGAVRGAIAGPSDWQLEQAQPLAVSFVSRRRGFLATVGGRLLATGDGGRSWHRVGPKLRFLRLDFLSTQGGYALTKSGVLLQTGDGGRARSRLHVFAGFPHQGLSAGTLEFVDRQHGFVGSADGRIYRSEDGGRTWARLPFGCGGVFFAFGGVAFVDPSRGYAICGSQAATVMQTKELFVTVDGGRHWRLRSRTGTRRDGLPWTGYADALAFPSANIGYLSADRAGVYRTSDGGRSWRTVLFSDDTYTVRDASWLDANTGYVLLYGSGLARTADGGRHWRQLYDPRSPQELHPPASAVPSGVWRRLASPPRIEEFSQAAISTLGGSKSTPTASTVFSMHTLSSAPAWWLGGLIFGAVVIALRLALNKRIGVLGGYSELVERASGRGKALGWKSFFLFGVLGGGLLYALVAGKYAGGHGYGWLARDFPHHAGLATGVGLVLAGVLIGFGAKTAGGCTSGNGFGGTTSGSPASFVATMTFFATAVGASFVLRGLFG